MRGGRMSGRDLHPNREPTTKHHPMKRMLIAAATTAALFLAPDQTRADVVIPVDAGDPWQGYMNVFELPANGGGYVFGSPWGTADLRASFSGSTLSLAPNTISDPNAFWYIGGGAPGRPGNKVMEASLYVQKSDGSLSGKSITFTGTVLSNSLGEHDAVAFIKDFAPDYSSVNITTVPLGGGPFEVTMDTLEGVGRHVQYGFQTTGVNVWPTDVADFGSVSIAAIPVAQADPNVTVNPASAWKGYMNVFNLPAPDGDGAYLPGVGGVWNTADLRAAFDGPVLTLAPSLPNPPGGLSDSYWFKADGSGNKTMEASTYVEASPGSFTGLTVKFTGHVLSNTLGNGHGASVFIKEFAPDYSSVVGETVVPLVPGAFNLSLAISNNPATHVQYGFQMRGPNVWSADAASAGSVRVASTAVDPFPAWIAGHDFSGIADADTSPAGDPDGDGRNNLEEFALNGNPASATASGRLRARNVDLGNGTDFVLTLPVRASAVFSGTSYKTASIDGIGYRVEGSTDLVTFDQTVEEVSPADSVGLPSVDSGWTYRSFRLAPANPAPGKGFLRVRVEKNP